MRCKRKLVCDLSSSSDESYEECEWEPPLEMVVPQVPPVPRLAPKATPPPPPVLNLPERIETEDDQPVMMMMTQPPTFKTFATSREDAIEDDIDGGVPLADPEPKLLFGPCIGGKDICGPFGRRKKISTPELKQFSPSFTRSNRSQAEEYQLLTNMVADHSPHGVNWLTPEDYDAITWDGSTIDVCTATWAERREHFLPASGWVVRGIREVFYEMNPFKDVTSPTPAELDNWHLRVIKHLRDLAGVNTPIEMDARLWLEARWSSERKWGTSWDVDYPPDDPSKPGTHWGESFFPNAGHRAPYIAAEPYNNNFTEYPELQNYNSRFSGASGIRAGKMAGIGWALMFAKMMAGWIVGEGCTGHAGPVLYRQKVGMTFLHINDSGNENVMFRGKWS